MQYFEEHIPHQCLYSYLSLQTCHREGEVVDCLLASAIHALHLLCTSAVTHDYAYIRDSTWRLAHSMLDLTQGLADTSTHNPPKVVRF